MALIADGVFAVTHTEDGWAQSNAGIVDLGDRVLIFDTFISPQATSDLRSAATALFSRPIVAVINSHYHNDHIWGNQTFPNDVPIIATRKTREDVTTLGVKEHQGFQAHSQGRLSASGLIFICLTVIRLSFVGLSRRSCNCQRLHWCRDMVGSATPLMYSVWWGIWTDWNL